MSFYNSLKQLWIKVQQKNIVLCSGNVDEIIPVDSAFFKKTINENKQGTNKFINLTEFLKIKANDLNVKFFSNYSPIKGNVLDGEAEENETNSAVDDEFQDDDLSNSLGIDQYIDWLNQQVELFKESNKVSKIIFVINFADILFNDRNPNLSFVKLAQLIESFLEYRNVIVNKFKKDY